ncbi:Ig-like domain repeat protein [Aeromicrobium fastidiosum]|uniref:Uncharacterized protein n=1 Tax=Aeromicrobium fastidiosum TaxID=52699 RepID=A0A641AH06_9ACTN|nr:Ig-like domain repeat protein [Aeromicrobium fastidiosum]KAA1372945.1 hypothetical protein ESP62_017765 [Aeromicrobium fastidiosum]MBP2390909.1 hypothetical protein [Aeromicrobium fastidiosum]
MSLTTRARRGLAGTLATALAAGGLLGLASPSQADPDVTPVTNASLTWNLNDEQGGGAFNGSCNFLSAGKAGDTGSSRAWTKTEYTPIAGNVRIEKPGRTTPWVTPIWETRCIDRSGKTVTASSAASTTENRVRLSAGEGSYAADGSGTISWTGSFTSAFYGGMTYWTATDPTLTVAADGVATLTADLSGYGASMTDTSLWAPLQTRNDQVIASFAGVDITATGFTAAPQYAGVDIDDTGYATPQVKTGSSWGSFPQQFVDFQQATGQSSYWYSSGGQRDAAKPAGPVALTFGTPEVLPVDTAPVVTPAPVPVPAPAPAPPAAPAKASTKKPTVKVSKRPTTKKAGKATITVTSAAPGAKPSGKAKVTLTKGKTKKTVTVTVKNGKATVKLPKLKKGTWKLKVSYAGSATQSPATSKAYTVKSK